MMRCEVGPDWAGTRLDRFASRWLSLPRQLLYKAIRTGLIRVSGRKAKPDYRLQDGEEVTATDLASSVEFAEEAAIPGPTADAIRSAIRISDPSFLVIDKPPDMPVHAGSGHAYGLIEILQHVLGVEPDALFRPALVHRLDRDTSGLILCALTPAALRHLARDLRRHRFHKRYTALVEGNPGEDSGRFAAPIACFPAERKKMRVASEGKPSETRFRVIESLTTTALLDLEPLTGRTHQIRVHCAHEGFPIAGDRLHGHADFNAAMHGMGLRRMFLHAHHLSFPHPETGDPVRAESQLPQDLATVLDALRTAPARW